MADEAGGWYLLCRGVFERFKADVATSPGELEILHELLPLAVLRRPSVTNLKKVCLVFTKHSINQL